MDPLLISVEEAAKALGIGRSAAYELIAKGELPRLKIGRRSLVPVQALAQYVDRALLAAGVAVAETETAKIASIPRPLQRTA